MCGVTENICSVGAFQEFAKNAVFKDKDMYEVVDELGRLIRQRSFKAACFIPVSMYRRGSKDLGQWLGEAVKEARILSIFQSFYTFVWCHLIVGMMGLSLMIMGAEISICAFVIYQYSLQPQFLCCAFVALTWVLSNVMLNDPKYIYQKREKSHED